MQILGRIRSKLIKNISWETARACGMSYAELLGLVSGWFYPSEQQLTALLRYFHIEERVP